MQRHDLGSLDLLAVFHRIAAGFFGLIGLVGLPATLIFGHLRRSSEAQDVAPLIDAYFGIFGGFALAVVILHLALAVVFLMAGGWLKSRRHYNALLAIEIVLLLVLPHGTALGVFGLIILLKPHVRAAFTS